MFKTIVTKILNHQAKQFFKRHKNIKLIVITGSVGKTSTKLAIATVLSRKFRVLANSKNHNMQLSVPPSLVGVDYPASVKNRLVWLSLIFKMQLKIYSKAEFDFVVQELGTDTPGDIKAFSYLKPDLAVVTAISPEHMEFFKTIDAVAAEELAIADFSKQLLINQDDIDQKYLSGLKTKPLSYGLTDLADYKFAAKNTNPSVIAGAISGPQMDQIDIEIKNAVGDITAKAAVAAAAVAQIFGLEPSLINDGVNQIQPVPGRMQLLRGVLESTLIDDTYNSSPLAIKSALKVLQNFPASQRIAILGSMNELGETSPEAHKAAGQLCDPGKIDWVITIGKDAGQYLAPAAQNNGCMVKSFTSPYEAGAFAHSVLKEGAVVLAKGSQNGVFAEEALKILLHDTTDEKKLVRQSASWMATKEKQFQNSILL